MSGVPALCLLVTETRCVRGAAAPTWTSLAQFPRWKAVGVSGVVGRSLTTQNYWRLV